MIKNSMFSCEEPKIKEYREIDLIAIIKEYLYFKGTYGVNNEPINKNVRLCELCKPAFWLYSLKNNSTNKMNVLYYCEKKAREMSILKCDIVIIPNEIWNECDKYNKEHIKKCRLFS